MEDGINAQQPGKTWAGAGRGGGGGSQPSVTLHPHRPSGSGEQQVPGGGAGCAGCRPLVAVLLLSFIYRSGEMR